MIHQTEPGNAIAASRRIAFVFPGQGSQYVGMGAELVKRSPAAAAAYERADAALGMPLSRLILEGPAEELDLTVNAQPAILATSYAFLEAMRDASSALERAYALAAGADVLLCVGSSLEVHPIAQLPGITRAHGGAVAVVTQGPTPWDHRAAVKLDGDVVAELEALVAAL